MAKQTSRLLTLIPELRNQIYEQAFAVPQTSVDLMKASPPSKALLLVCRQTYQEAKGLYNEAYRRYWNETDFFLGSKARAHGARMACTQTELSQISHLRITSSAPVGQLDYRLGLGGELLEVLSARYVLTLRRAAKGKWICEKVDGVPWNPSEMVNGVEGKWFLVLKLRSWSCEAAWVSEGYLASLEMGGCGFQPVTKGEIRMLLNNENLDCVGRKDSVAVTWSDVVRG